MKDRDTGQRREAEPVLLDETAKLREEALRKLVSMSRGFPQMGPTDPAGMAEQSIALASDRAGTRKNTPPTQTPEAKQPQSDFLSRYRWGIFSLIREIADDKSGSLAEDSQVTVADHETQPSATQSRKPLHRL